VFVTPENVDLVRTQQRQPKAEIGQWLVKFGDRDADVKLMEHDHFQKYYRLPR
jgi:hypothetical protein